MKDLGERIQKARKNKGYSQETLANLFGISRQAIQKWEKGENEPSIDSVKRLAQLLDVDFTYLLTGEINVSKSVSAIDNEKEIIKEKKQEEKNVGKLIVLSITLFVSIVVLMSLVIFSFFNKQNINGTLTSLWWYIPFVFGGTNAWFIFLFLISIAGIVLSIIFLVRRRKK